MPTNNPDILSTPQHGEMRLGRLLGQGAFSEVREAEHPRYGRVAVKIANDPKASFENEASFMNACSNKRSSRIPRALAEGDGYLVMQRGPEQSLSDWRVGKSLHDALELAAKLCEVLDEVHEAGFVHCDVKPANVLVDVGGPWLVDFGIACRIGMPNYSSNGGVPGTPVFMAPEQLTAAPLDGGADIYAVGVLLYWMVSGRFPVEDGLEPMKLLRRKLDRTFIPLSLLGADEQLDEILDRFLEPNPRRRPNAQQARDLLMALRVVLPNQRLPLRAQIDADAPTAELRAA